jgi:phenylpropionate dioxygenase-like ring-hydroxylating dioxygenase large terminal subunit
MRHSGASKYNGVGQTFMSALMASDHLQQEWLSMRRRLVARIAERGADLQPQTTTLSSSNYVDPARFAREKSELFLKTPLLAAMSCELTEAGDVLVFDAAGPSIILVRQADGSIGAWLNKCPHRGMQLVEENGSRQALVCPFHGWRFALDGELMYRPRADAFDKGLANHLFPVPVSEWGGMIFVRADEKAGAIDVEAFLGPMAPLIKAMELETAQFVARDELRADTNWKMALDTFCESYHVPATHPETLAPQLVPLVSIDDSFGRHHRYSGPNRYMQECVGVDEAEWPESHYSAVHYVFPNTTFTYADAIDGDTPVFAMFRLFPGDEPGQTRALATTCKPGSALEVEDASFQQLHEHVLHIVSTEDFKVAQALWQNYSRAPQPAPVVFGRNEMILQRYHVDIADQIGMPLE